MDNQPYYTIAQAACFLGVSAQAVRTAITRGGLTCELEGSKRVIRRDVLEAWKAYSQPNGKPEPGRRPYKNRDVETTEAKDAG